MIKKIKFTIYLFFPFYTYSQLSVKVDNLAVNESFEFACFNYPNSIEIGYLGFDSIFFEGGEVTFFDLDKENMVTKKFETSKIDINSSGKLSAHYASKEEPIVVNFKKAYGYINGDKERIKQIEKPIFIKLSRISLLIDDEYERINGRSNLILSIDDDLITGQSIQVDSSSTFTLSHHEGYDFIKGNSIMVVLSDKGTPRPIWKIEFKSLEELNNLLKVKLGFLKNDVHYALNFSLYYRDFQNSSQKEIESLFYLLNKK